MCRRRTSSQARSQGLLYTSVMHSVQAVQVRLRFPFFPLTSIHTNTPLRYLPIHRSHSTVLERSFLKIFGVIEITDAARSMANFNSNRCFRRSISRMLVRFVLHPVRTTSPRNLEDSANQGGIVLICDHHVDCDVDPRYCESPLA